MRNNNFPNHETDTRLGASFQRMIRISMLIEVDYIWSLRFTSERAKSIRIGSNGQSNRNDNYNNNIKLGAANHNNVHYYHQNDIATI